MRRTNARKVLQRLRSEGPEVLAQRAVRRLHDRLGAGHLDFPLLPGDVADSGRLDRPEPRLVTTGRPLRVGWVCTPPSAGSGGHTTMFRMIQALEDAGHECVLLLYDRHGGELQQQAQVVADGWPWVRPRVTSLDAGLREVDAVIATGWPTAHALASRAPEVPCLYFIQDYEPFFYPAGSEHALAADTYRFGFTNIALGSMVQDRLRSELGVSSVLVPFSCDTDTYGLRGRGTRSGVVFYTKPDVARRGYRLGALALAEFHRRHPEHTIHVYGDPAPAIEVPVVHHGRLSPRDLDELYNSCVAGIAMSFTNISLVAEEMLAAGCIPVVNASADSRADLPNPHVAWAGATPSALADALSAVVERADEASAAAAAASVRDDNWRLAGRRVVEVVEQAARGQLGTS